MDTEAQFLQLQMPFHTLDWACFTFRKPTKILRVRNGVGHQTEMQQGNEVPTGAPQALSATVQADWASLGDTHLYVQTHK